MIHFPCMALTGAKSANDDAIAAHATLLSKAGAENRARKQPQAVEITEVAVDSIEEAALALTGATKAASTEERPVEPDPVRTDLAALDAGVTGDLVSPPALQVTQPVHRDDKHRASQQAETAWDCTRQRTELGCAFRAPMRVCGRR